MKDRVLCPATLLVGKFPSDTLKLVSPRSNMLLFSNDLPDAITASQNAGCNRNANPCCPVKLVSDRAASFSA
jgi:hypothetical protein